MRLGFSDILQDKRLKREKEEAEKAKKVADIESEKKRRSSSAAVTKDNADNPIVIDDSDRVSTKF